MSRHLPIAESVPRQVVSTMRQWIETPESLHNSILVGGGSFLFKKAVKAAFPEQRIHDVREPLYANVMGFQLVRQNQVMTSFAPPVTSDSATGWRCKSAQEWRPHRPIPLAFGLSRAEKPPLFDELSQFPQGRRRVDRLPR